MASDRYDVIIVGSGAGGAAAAYKLARADKQVLMLERGRHLPVDGSTLDTKQIFKEGKFKNKEPWLDGKGGHLVPGEYYNVGGKTKWYGAALMRFSAHEFQPDPGTGASAGRSAWTSSSSITTRPSVCCTSTGSTTRPNCRL